MTHLKEGDKAPDFNLETDEGQNVSLNQFRGEKLILFFYPKDDTPGCTKEACNLRDNYSKLRKLGFNVLGISPDSVKKHQKFKEKFEFQYNLAADPNLEAIHAYGVWGLKKFMGREYEGLHRTTFVINENGIIEKVIDKVKTKEHAEQILEELSIA